MSLIITPSILNGNFPLTMLLSWCLFLLQKKTSLHQNSPLWKNSEEKENFIKEISYIIKNIDVSDLLDSNKLENTTNSLTLSLKNTWRMNSKWVNITRYSKSWWNEEYSLALSNYRLTRSLDNWKLFKSKVKLSKRSFFDLKIQEIANKK